MNYKPYTKFFQSIISRIALTLPLDDGLIITQLIDMSITRLLALVSSLLNKGILQQEQWLFLLLPTIWLLFNWARARMKLGIQPLLTYDHRRKQQKCTLTQRVYWWNRSLEEYDWWYNDHYSLNTISHCMAHWGNHM